MPSNLSPFLSQWANLLSAVHQLLNQWVITSVPTRGMLPRFLLQPLRFPSQNRIVWPVLLNTWRLQNLAWKNAMSVIACIFPSRRCSGLHKTSRMPISTFPFCHLINTFCILWLAISISSLSPFPLVCPPPPGFPKNADPNFVSALFSRDLRCGYLDDLLWKNQFSCQTTSKRRYSFFLSFSWILNLQKSCLDPSHRLEYLGLMPDTSLSDTFSASIQNLSNCSYAIAVYAK